MKFMNFKLPIRPKTRQNLQPFCSAMTPFVCLLRIKIHSMAWKNILGIASHYTDVICKSQILLFNKNSPSTYIQ